MRIIPKAGASFGLSVVSLMMATNGYMIIVLGIISGNRTKPAP
ncbi:MAG: hypothetical protein WA137_02705 [Methanothrix sp.]